MHSPLLYSFKIVGKVHGETVMKDRTRVLCDWMNTSAEKLDKLTGTKTRAFKALLSFLDNGVNVTVPAHFKS